jgi:tryptophan halogenase
MQNSIRSVLIVGGGTAGWMTAAYLNRFLDPAKCQVTLVESADLGTIGVGEATVPPLVAYLRLLGVDENDFLVQCNASYKLGIKFTGWLGGTESFWHPFGQNGGTIDGVPVFHHWLREQRAGREPAPYAAYTPQMVLGEMNRAPRSPSQETVITQQGAYAFHLDAKAFANYLMRLATFRGVHHLVDNVSEVALDDQGMIATVRTQKGRTLSADLYIDCSGFAGLLIEQALGDKHIDWSKTLLCDRAVVLQVPSHGPMTPYTRATALSAGWAWRIPLAHRTGSGYVYSSHHLSEEAAAQELVAHMGQDADAVTPGHLKMRVGRREHFWVRNCVAVGLAAGFLEPLESTGIFLIQKSIELLLSHFPDRGFSPALAREYNARLGAVYEEMRDFILLHYLLNQRNEAFWKTSRAVLVPPSLAHTLDYYDRTGLVDWQNPALFHEPSFYSIAAGMGRLPQTGHAMAAYADSAGVGRALDSIKAANFSLAQAMPDHADLIATLHASRPPAAP